MESGRQQVKAHRFEEQAIRQEEPAGYEKRLLRAYDRLEKPLYKMVLLGFVLLIFAQLALAFPMGRKWLSSTDQLEGVRSGNAIPTAATDKNHAAELTIRLVGTTASLPNVWVKVDGVPVGAFSKPQVNVSVHNGDVITVDSSAVPGVFRFQIDHNDPAVSFPVPGSLFESNEDDKATIGPVEFME